MMNLRCIAGVGLMMVGGIFSSGGCDVPYRPAIASGRDGVREEYRCETCKSFAPLVRAFELRFSAAQNAEEQREALAMIRMDPTASLESDEAFVYSYGVETLQKDTATDTYTVRLTFRCRCSPSTVIPMTLVIKGSENYYRLFLE